MKTSRNLRIGAFVYNFEHKKTYEGLMRLHLENYSLACALAADRIELTHYQSKIRVAPKGLEYMHPRDIARQLDIPYHVAPHNSEECARLIKDYNLDLGVILGARILDESVINAFNVGVLNLHPGLLPDVRGLDTIKWAIFDRKKQGVTTHLIDKHIDRGRMILRRETEVYEDDTLVDVFLRIHNLEMTLMTESLNILEQGRREFDPITNGKYNKAVPEEIERNLPAAFEAYKRNYSSL